jgi:hypothetical protein
MKTLLSNKLFSRATGAPSWKLEVEAGTFEGLQSRTATDAIYEMCKFCGRTINHRV